MNLYTIRIEKSKVTEKYIVRILIYKPKRKKYIKRKDLLK